VKTLVLRTAKWRGCTVAVKVLSHEDSQSARVNALHESVVSQHVSHPNVVSALASWLCKALPFMLTTHHVQS
jgi:hypothetical protein